MTPEQKRATMEDRLGVYQLRKLDALVRQGIHALDVLADKLADPSIDSLSLYDYWTERGYYVAKGIGIK